MTTPDKQPTPKAELFKKIQTAIQSEQAEIVVVENKEKRTVGSPKSTPNTDDQ
jgi:hypothetical protein